MLSDSNGKLESEVELFFMAGFATAPHFMEKMRVALHGLIEHWGQSVHSELLFPYGDWSRGVVPQLWEIRSDMWLGLKRLNSSIGGNRALTLMNKRRTWPDHGRKTTILIGHSGGGVAAVHAAQILLSEQQGCSDYCVVMIGSPRCRIPESLRPSVLAISAAGTDFISRLGTYGGWKAGKRRFPSWHRDKHAPADTRVIPIIGGHADYFRDSAPYVNLEGISNLALTLEAIASWLSAKIRK
jgi:hypothetical protein